MALAAMAVEGGTLTSAISSVMGVVSTVMTTIKSDEILLALWILAKTSAIPVALKHEVRHIIIFGIL